MAFTQDQVRKLKSSVRRVHVRERQVEGKTLHYLEGWKVVSEANRIFGFEAWDRETVSSECVWRTPHDQGFAAAYVTRVRIRVRAGDEVIVREGLGSAEAIASTPGQAHERASKAAETDATKRALSTFGNRFGLSLYGERSDAAREPNMAPDRPIKPLGTVAARVVRDVAAQMKETTRTAKDAFDRAAPLVRHKEGATDAGVAYDGYVPYRDGWRSMRGAHPFTRGPSRADPPKSDEEPARPEEHRSEQDAVGEGGAEGAAASGVATGVLPVRLPTDIGRIDKSVLTLSEPKRLRDRAHLKFVARQPCLVCARTPSQAHHVRIAQPRALGRKVSDEFAVPLCALHHHDLHMKGNEASWWSGHRIDPLPIAEDLWSQSRTGVEP